MKNISTLKTIINVFYWLLLLSFGSAILALLGINLVGFFTSGEGLSIFSIFNSWQFLLIFIPLLVLYFLFIKGVHHLRATMPLLSTGDLFTEKVSEHFSKAGKLFSIVGVLGILCQFIFPLITSSKMKVTLDFTTIGCIFLIIIGLFFLFFGEVFQKAKAIQEENNLTI
jgi:hypothetical protein